MPELPDLQVFSGNLDKELSGKKVEKITVKNKRKLKTSGNELKKALEHQKLKEVYRSGKQLHFVFANGNVLALHLMLHGDLHLFEKKNTHKNTILELLFSDGTGLALTDFQGMATPTLNPGETEVPDALDRKVSYTFLKYVLSPKRTSIKTLLMDQKLIRGIGNAYADEILWEAGISPFSAANKIPDTKIKQLAKSIKAVLRNAEKQIRKKHPDIISGEIRDFLKIHNTRKRESPTGATIQHRIVSSRKTYYTDEQTLYS